MKIISVQLQPTVRLVIYTFGKTHVIEEPTLEVAIKRARKIDDYLLSIDDVMRDINIILEEQAEESAENVLLFTPQVPMLKAQ